MKFIALLGVVGIVIASVACGSESKSSGAYGGSGAAAAPTQPLAPTAVPTVAAPALPALSAAALAGAPGGSNQARVNGTVQTVTDGKVTLADGSSFMLAPNARIARLSPIKATDLAKGQFVAITAKRQPDNTLLASIVSIFPPSLSGVVPGGERPLPEGNLMTNATIDTISGNQFTVTFTGGGSRVTIATDATLIKQDDATVANLPPGTMINAGVNNGVAASVYIP